MKYLSYQLVSWKLAITDTKYIMFFGTALAYCLGGLYITPVYFNYIQNRVSISINDPILNFLPSLDVSFFIFNLMNVCALFTLFWLLMHPKYFAISIMTWAFVYTFRYIAMFLLNLDTPVGYVKLSDPMLDGIVYEGQVISKDLFFSGHTSYMFMMFLVVKNSILKRVNLIGTACVGFLLLVQHNHYFIDIIAAPFFTWLSFTIASTLYDRQVK
jgi:hypothetical protein